MSVGGSVGCVGLEVVEAVAMSIENETSFPSPWVHPAQFHWYAVNTIGPQSLSSKHTERMLRFKAYRFGCTLGCSARIGARLRRTEHWRG